MMDAQWHLLPVVPAEKSFSSPLDGTPDGSSLESPPSAAVAAANRARRLFFFSFFFLLVVFSVCCMCQFIICSVKSLHAGINVTLHDVSFWPFDDVLAGVTVGRRWGCPRPKAFPLIVNGCFTGYFTLFGCLIHLYPHKSDKHSN